MPTSAFAFTVAHYAIEQSAGGVELQQAKITAEKGARIYLGD